MYSYTYLVLLSIASVIDVMFLKNSRKYAVLNFSHMRTSLMPKMRIHVELHCAGIRLVILQGSAVTVFR